MQLIARLGSLQTVNATPVTAYERKELRYMWSMLDVQSLTCGQLRQHWLRTRVFKRLNGATATAPGLILGHAMGLRLMSRLAKAGSLCPAGKQVPCQVKFSDVGCKSPELARWACMHACMH